MGEGSFLPEIPGFISQIPPNTLLNINIYFNKDREFYWDRIPCVFYVVVVKICLRQICVSLLCINNRININTVSLLLLSENSKILKVRLSSIVSNLTQFGLLNIVPQTKGIACRLYPHTFNIYYFTWERESLWMYSVFSLRWLPFDLHLSATTSIRTPRHIQLLRRKS